MLGKILSSVECHLKDHLKPPKLTLKMWCSGKKTQSAKITLWKISSLRTKLDSFLEHYVNKFSACKIKSALVENVRKGQ